MFYLTGSPHGPSAWTLILESYGACGLVSYGACGLVKAYIFTGCSIFMHRFLQSQFKQQYFFLSKEYYSSIVLGVTAKSTETEFLPIWHPVVITIWQTQPWP